MMRDGNCNKTLIVFCAIKFSKILILQKTVAKWRYYGIIIVGWQQFVHKI